MAIRHSIREFFTGVGIVFRGLRTWSTSPRLMALGLIPGIVTFAIMVTAWVIWAVNAGTVASTVVSWFIQSDSSWVALLELVVTFAMLIGAVLLAVYLFTTVTLSIGGPFFERLSQSVDQSLGFAGSAPRESWWAATMRSTRESFVRLILTVLTSATAFVVGLVPGIGSALGFTLTASVGSHFLAMELVAIPAARRGVVTRIERRDLLARRKALSRGYGVAVYLVFLVPGMAVMMMPAVAAGSTLLVRELNGEPSRPPRVSRSRVGVVT